MPQTYTHFSVVVPCSHPEAVASTLIAEQDAILDEQAEPEIFSDDQVYGVGFVAEEGGVWISDDGTGEGNVEAAVDAVSYILSQPGSPSYVVIEWANTCSRPIPGEIGGGVVVVTERTVRYDNTWQAGQRLLEQAIAEEGIE